MTFNKAVISSQKIDYVQNRCFTVVDCNETKYNQGTEITATVNTSI